MFRTIVTAGVLLVGFMFGGKAQNLVPNPNFDQFSNCPNAISQLFFASPWNPPNQGTSDFYHSCAPLQSLAGVPWNFVGRQFPLAGSGYGGLILYSNFGSACSGPNGANYREYIQVPLLSPLQAGQNYCVSLYASPADAVAMVSDAFGIHFSDTSIGFFSNFLPLSDPSIGLQPQLVNSIGMLTDTVNWTRLEWTYQASGGEAFMVIGNFLPDSLTQTLNLFCGNTLNQAYWYIDSIAVRPGPCQTILSKWEITHDSGTDFPVLRWTFEEPGIEYFVVERSRDGKYFAEIERIMPAPKGDYRLDDPEAPKGWLLYRVAAVNKNGLRYNSNILRLHQEVQSGMNVSYPRSGGVLIQQANTGETGAAVELYDLKGKLLKKISSLQEGFLLKTNRFPPGLYVLRSGNWHEKILLK